MEIGDQAVFYITNSIKLISFFFSKIQSAKMWNAMQKEPFNDLIANAGKTGIGGIFILWVLQIFA